MRHEPWLYELDLDEEGWVDLESLLSGLRTQCNEWRRLAQQDIVQVNAAADKKRFEIKGGQIRALYGHSTPQRLRKVPAAPPPLLYHGTSSEAAKLILVEGLKPMSRQYVHLSVNQVIADQVGRRKGGGKVVILDVAAGDAHVAGVAFYEGNDLVWLADNIPATYVRASGGEESKAGLRSRATP